jgi:hypothetical protein
MPWRGLARVERLWDFRATAQFILLSLTTSVFIENGLPTRVGSLEHSLESHVYFVRILAA